MRSHAKAIVAVSAMLLTLALAPAAPADAPPLVTVDPATPSYASAQLSGTVNPNGGPSTTFWQLQYSITGEEGSWAVAGSGEFSGTEAEETTPLPVSAEATGLQHDTAYFQRIVAFNEDGANQAIKAGPSFTTLEVAPTSVSIDLVSTFTATTATFTGDINPNAPEPEPTTPEVEKLFRVVYRFECTPACPNLEGGGGVEADNSSHEVQDKATKLLPGTEYEVSLIAEKKIAGLEASAGPATFTTPPLPPAVASTSASELATTSAKLNAYIKPNGLATTYHFEYVTAQQFEESGFAAATSTPESDPIGSDSASHAVANEIDSLAAGASYRFRVVATNSLGTSASPAKLFSTPAQEVVSQYPGQGFLPNDRAWEMVSPPDKNGGNIAAESRRTRAAVDGEAIQFTSLSGFADVKGSGIAFEYIARRTAEPDTNGWSTHSITPRQDAIPMSALSGSATYAEPRYVGELAPDLSRGIFKSFSPVSTASDPHPMVEKAFNFYLGANLSVPGGASYELISDCPACAVPLPYSSGNSSAPFIAGTNRGDGTREPLTNALYQTNRRLTVDAPSNTQLKVYEGLADATDEYQTVAVNATAGQFRLEFNGQSTGDIAFDAPPTGSGSVEAALDALSTIAPGSVSVTGGPGDSGATKPYVVGFTDGAGIEGSDAPQLVAVPGTIPLSGGGAAVASATRLSGGQHVRLAGRIPTLPAIACDDGAAPACTVPSSSTAGTSSASSSYAFNSVSDDGSRVFFRSSVSGVQRVYMREGGLRTIQLSASEATIPAAAKEARYWTASTDGSKIFFSTSQTLVDEDTNGLTDLYMYDASKPASAPDNLTLISKGSGGSGAVSFVIGASEDGSHVYFIGGTQLVAGEPTDAFGSLLFHWHEGTLAYIGALGYVDDGTPNTPATSINFIETLNTARVSADGHLLFMTRGADFLAGRGGFAGYGDGNVCTYDGGSANQPCPQLYAYSPDDGSLRCASCHPSGVSTVASGSALINSRKLIGTANAVDPHLSQAISSGGRYVFFHTGEPLVAEDRNGQIDVYVYDAQSEEQRLISSGESLKPSYFLDASDDGRDVFFATAERLSKWDVDTLYDVYDARVGGGLPEPPLPPPSCQGDACQPPPVSLNDPTPSSSSLQGPGNASDRKQNSRCPRGKRRIKSRGGKVRCVKRGRRTGRGTDDNGRAGR